MKPEDTLYEVLEISPRASHEVVKAAYRCLAQFHHPDKSASTDSANANFKLVAINNAYAVLSNPISRQAYDSRMGFHSTRIDRRTACGAQKDTVPTPGPRSQESRPFGFQPI
nr:J domain-containing protein [uncultured Albidiferax sp.]